MATDSGQERSTTNQMCVGYDRNPYDLSSLNQPPMIIQGCVLVQSLAMCHRDGNRSFSASFFDIPVSLGGTFQGEALIDD